MLNGECFKLAVVGADTSCTSSSAMSSILTLPAAAGGGDSENDNCPGLSMDESASSSSAINLERKLLDGAALLALSDARSCSGFLAGRSGLVRSIDNGCSSLIRLGGLSESPAASCLTDTSPNASSSFRLRGSLFSLPTAANCRPTCELGFALISTSSELVSIATVCICNISHSEQLRR